MKADAKTWVDYECWRRLERIIDQEGMNINQFALSIGLARSEALYQIKRGHTKITRNIADRITNKYPYYSYAWVLTGCGPMMADIDGDSQYIPYYKCDISEIPALETLSPESHMFLPQVGDADFAFSYLNDDMVPSVPSGTIIVLQRKSIDTIVYGAEHIVVSDNMVVLRRVRRASDVRILRLEAACREYYDDIMMPVGSVRQIYAVKAKIIVKR